jgi:TRAP transporter TAXI family solute receptor
VTALRSIAIATSEENSTFHHQAVALGEIWRAEGLVDRATPLFTGGSVENAHLVAAGKADFGCMAANWLPLAATGKPPFRAPLPVQLLTPINTGPLFFVAAASSPLRTFADLKGKRVALGVENSGMVQHVHSQFRALNLSLDTIQPVYVNASEGGEMLIRGEVDAVWEMPIPNVHFTNLAQRMPLRVLPFSDGERRRIMDAVPYYGEAVIPKGAFPGHDQDVITPGVINILAVNANAPDDWTDQLTRAVIARAKDLAARNPLFLGLDKLLAEAPNRIIPVLEKAGAHQHRGAQRAFA